MISKNWTPVLALAASACALVFLPTCRSTRHTVARVVTPTPGPAEVFVPAAPEPALPPETPTPAVAMPSPTPSPTVVAMPVVTAPAPGVERSPGVLYEQLVPTVAPITPAPAPEPAVTRTPSPRSTRPPRTETPGPTRKPGVYYEDPEGRPLPTVTPAGQ